MDKLTMVVFSIGVIILVATLKMISAALSAWPLMVLLGILGHTFGVEELFLSFWRTFVLTLGLTLIIPLLSDR